MESNEAKGDPGANDGPPKDRGGGTAPQDRKRNRRNKKDQPEKQHMQWQEKSNQAKKPNEDAQIDSGSQKEPANLSLQAAEFKPQPSRGRGGKGQQRPRFDPTETNQPAEESKQSGRGRNARGRGRQGPQGVMQGNAEIGQRGGHQNQKPQEGGESLRGNRGGRGRGRGERPRRPQTAVESEKPAKVRGGRPPPILKKDADPDEFFHQRKMDREEFESGAGNALEFGTDPSRSNNHQHRKGRGGTAQGSKFNAGMAGSTRHAIGDGSEFEKGKKVEMLQIVKKKDNPRLKEKALVKYNFQDFLNQNHNLTDQCKAFVEALSNGSQECVICSNPIYQKSALWNCKQCSQPFHLGCIKRWIRKLNPAKGGEGDDEEEKEPYDENARNPDQELEEAADDQYEQENRKASKQMMAFFCWTCPNCNYSYAENQLPRYKCHCGRFEEPAYSPMVLPHSCGEYCDRKKHDGCTHGRCDIMCHPGSCPPCSITVPASCHCGKEQQRVPCQLANRSKFGCENTCAKLLNCLSHECVKQCHEGNCELCDVQVSMKCFCGKDEYSAPCGSKRKKCGRICGATLDCGKHECERKCHEGPCAPCPKDPERMRFCPCGHNSIESLIGRKRKACTDPVPLCSHECERFLPCGKHQCQKTCHQDKCELCTKNAEQKCRCGKDSKTVPCYTVNYPEELRDEIMSPEEQKEQQSFKCTKVCNQNKSCKRHKCKDICCPVKKGGPDPCGTHMCLIECNKTLSCGVHKCNDFCHISFCKPCRVYSREPLFCPCGIAKMDPPIKCGQVQPTCQGPCKKKLDCGHMCALKCHLGGCPPCLEPVTKTCVCGKETYEKSYCNSRSPNCGQACSIPMRCGHICQKVCHPKGTCFESIDDLMLNGCGQRCMKPRETCPHRCQSLCHPGHNCPGTPCDAEMRHYCKCGHRYVLTICKSIEDRQPIDCNAECWKDQREKKMANAFGSSKEFEENKTGIKMEYYPENALQLASQQMKFAMKVEDYLCDVTLKQSTKSFINLTGEKRNFVMMYAFEHFKLDMCTYGGKGGATSVTDVFWKNGCRVPEIMCSEVVTLISKGIMPNDLDASKSSVFEATIYISNIPKGSNVEDLKQHLSAFQNEFYTERRSQPGQARTAQLHFYQIARAKDAYTYLRNSPHQFSVSEFVIHKKQIGTREDAEQDPDEFLPKKKKVTAFDDDGFEIVQKKK